LGSPKPSLSASAYHVGRGWIVSVEFPTAGLAQGAIGCAVHVNVRLPAVTSAALGVYVVFVAVAFANVPVPFVDHIPEDELDANAAIVTGPLPAHVE
jgi:hypothetical protein